MSHPAFRNHIRLALADAQLQAALDANARRRTEGREAAFASLPDWRTRRQRAHAVRSEVVAHLDDYLGKLVSRARHNGIHVHRAGGAAEAIAKVLEIGTATTGITHSTEEKVAGSTREGRGDLLFAKSKSMVSEEINLNHALEDRGHRVVETDLGEYIVQLRGEKPAHIITPAVHLQRAQVGKLFAQRLGVAYTDDIPTLTATARKVLRDVFLTADIGISGVNFGVAATGTLCIITNEGNGRMVTTVPPVHIALMGMERIVPTLEDLALMLSLLPRSATGQKLTVYTQLIQSPRRPGETDGPAERHLIILDNGRSQMRASGLEEALYCIRCGACLNACPVFREIGGHAYVGASGEPAPYPGPIGSVVSPGLQGLAHFGQLAQASSLCGACQEACPVDIDLPKLLTRVRAGEPAQPAGSKGTALSFLSRLGLTAYGIVAASPGLFALAQRLAALGGAMLSPSSSWMRLPDLTGWESSRDFPRPAKRSFRQRWPQIRRNVSKQGGPARFGGKGNIKPEASAGHTPGATEQVGRGKELVERFVDELGALGAQCTRVQRETLPEQIIQFLRSHSAESVLAWDSIEDMNTAALMEAGIVVVKQPDPRVRFGLTSCAGAIAETGTLVLTNGPGRPLTASLLPEVHIAVVRVRQIVRTLEEALRLPDVTQCSSTVLISGPSRTADIEMTLTIGVHGPKELHVYVVE
ncbi:MAG: LUD domain-containing protein [Anaerolineales bacterium]